jgi:hypothetical protein
MTLLQICEWLESTRLAELVTQSLYGFQIVVAVHLIAWLPVGTVICRPAPVVLRRPGVRGHRRLALRMLAGFTMMFAPAP